MFCEVGLISGSYRGGGGWQLLYPVVFLLWLGRGSIGTSIKGEGDLLVQV